MSLDIKRVCDRCRKEIPEGGEFTSVTGNVYLHSVKEILQKRLFENTDKRTKFDLCEECAEKLNEFVNGKGKEECSGRS